MSEVVFQKILFIGSKKRLNGFTRNSDMGNFFCMLVSFYGFILLCVVMVVDTATG